MRCPKCASNDDKVIETRISKEGDTIRRRRQCLQCGFRFTTYESIIPADIYVVKRDGRREDFKQEKLRDGIRMACWKRNISQEQIETIVRDISTQLMSLPQSEVESQYIGELVMRALRNIDEVAYVRFASVYRHFKDVEAFINEINKMPAKEGEPERADGEEKPAGQNEASPEDVKPEEAKS